MRTLGVDFGEARIGVALSDDRGIVAMPHSVIAEKDKGAQTRKVVALVRETGAGRVVVGIPYEMSGRAGPMAEMAEKFATKLETLLGQGIPVARIDERLTSVSAKRVLAETGGGRRGGHKRRRAKGDVDMLAATFILQSYLDSSRGPAPREGPTRR